MERIRITKPWLHIVENDTLGIGERLRKIESGYFIVFNTQTNMFEVHSADNRGPNTFAFVVPFKQLDSRTLDYCEETMVRNSDKLIKQMEENNRKIREQQKKDFDNKVEAASLETVDELTYAMDKDEMHSGYKRTFGGVTI